MYDDDAPAEEIKPGAPAWLATFADLMSLLMCFFVLLLAFSEMDVLKFKQLAGSMREAFGVQRDIKANEMPKGTSIIAQEFSPGRPQPTPIVDLRQFTTEDSKENLDFGDVKKAEDRPEPQKPVEKDELDDLKKALQEELRRKIQQQLARLQDMLSENIDEGQIDLQSHNNEIVIRIREKGSFPSGSAQLNESFYPILNRIGSVLKEVDGQIVVSGHTDNVPIFTSKYPSNWVLSAARAASVVHYLTKYPKVSGDRIEIRAHGESKPIADNSTADGRAQNRRVEISVRYGGIDAIASDDLRKVLQAGDNAAIDAESLPEIPPPAAQPVQGGSDAADDLAAPSPATE